MLGQAIVSDMILEYTARFDQPQIGLISGELPKIFEAVVHALLPLGFKLSNSEIVSSAIPADQKWIFRLPELGLAFQFGPEEYRFTKVRFDWQRLQDDLELLATLKQSLGNDRVVQNSGSTVRISMHVQAASQTGEQLLEPLTPMAFRKLSGNSPLAMLGTMMRLGDTDALIERSGTYANGVFVQLTSAPTLSESVEETIQRVRATSHLIMQAIRLEQPSHA